jgi:hypothetical protein
VGLTSNRYQILQPIKITKLLSRSQPFVAISVLSLTILNPKQLYPGTTYEHNLQ